MIYKNLLISQANEIAQLLDEYVVSHNKMLQSAGTFKSLFKSVDFSVMYKEVDKVKTNFEKKAYELKEIKEEYYGNFADVSMKFFDALESYFNALFDAVKQLHLLIFRLYETSRGIINNKRKLSLSEYSQLTRIYNERVKGYIDLGNKLNQAYQVLEDEPDDFIGDEAEETKAGFIQISLLIVIAVSILTASTGIGAVLYKKGKLPFINKRNNAIQTTQTPSPNLTPDLSLTQKPQSEVLEENKGLGLILDTCHMLEAGVEPKDFLELKEYVKGIHLAVQWKQEDRIRTHGFLQENPKQLEQIKPLLKLDVPKIIESDFYPEKVPMIEKEIELIRSFENP